MRSAALRLGGPIQPASFSSVTRASSNLRRILSIEGLPNAVLFEFLGKALGAHGSPSMRKPWRELRTNTGQSNPGRDVDCLRAITAWTASSHTPEGFDCARYCAASNYGCSVAPEGCTKITVVTRLLACSVDFRRSRD